MLLGNRKIKDRLLLKKAVNDRCSASLADIYKKYGRMICDFLRKQGADDISEDICQSVFTHISEGNCKYDGSSEVRSYLFGFANNLLRQEIKSSQIATYNLSQLHIKQSLSDSPRNSQCPAAILEDEESRQIFLDAISRLPLNARQAIKLVYIDGIPAKKASKIAKCDFKVFRKRLDYGLKCLRKGIKDLQCKSYSSKKLGE